MSEFEESELEILADAAFLAWLDKEFTIRDGHAGWHTIPYQYLFPMYELFKLAREGYELLQSEELMPNWCEKNKWLKEING